MRGPLVLVLAASLAGCASATLSPAKDGASAGAGFSWALTPHRTPGVEMPRAIVLDGSYRSGAGVHLLDYEHGPLDGAWTLAVKDRWTFTQASDGTHLVGSVVEDRTAPESFRRSEATIGLSVTGALPDGHYVVELRCYLVQGGATRECPAPTPVAFDIVRGALVAS